MNSSLFEQIIIILINASSVFLIIVILANSFKDRLYRWFVIMTVFLIGWVDFAYLGYAEKSIQLATIFYRLNWAFVSLFIFSAYVFYIECFLSIKKVKTKKLIFILSSLFILASLFTETIIKEVIGREWGNEIKFGFLNDFFSLYTFLFACVLVYYFIKKYVKLPKEEQRRIKYFLVATILLILFNVIFNVLSPVLTHTAKYQHLGDYSSVIFLAFTAFAMLRRQFLNVKVALTAFLISIIGILLIIDIIALSGNNLVIQGVKFIILIFFVGISVILVRSVLAEIRQREQLQVLNKSLDESRQRYIDLASEQKDIIDVMGHEIRTPLSIIKQELNYFKEVMLPKEKDWEAGKFEPKEVTDLFTSLHNIDEEVDQTLALVTDMLETARIDKQRFELTITEFDVVDLAKKSFEANSKSDTGKKFEFKFNAPDLNTLMIKADETRIRESVDALLTNAIKYGKTIDGSPAIIEMEITKDQANVYISVKDNGRGIDKEDIQKLGKKFVRLDPKTANLERPGGTGLGLFVVKNIMNYHKGDLIIESEGIGKGSIFKLKIPLVTVQAAQVKPTEVDVTPK